MNDKNVTNLPNPGNEFFKLIPQEGVKHRLLDELPEHNAIWDMNISPDGRVYFSACGEGRYSVCAWFYEYEHENARFIPHFDLAAHTIQEERALYASKFHTCIDFMEDSRIIACSHTTSPSPMHPTWMPYAYVNHQWEGFQGSDIFIYDPKSGIVKNCGRISPYDSTYGGAYTSKTGEYFMVTMIQGTGYVYNTRTGKHRSLGQVCDPTTCRLFCASDGNIYTSSSTGAFFRYNADLGDVEFYGPDCEVDSAMEFMHERDGLLYMSTIAGQNLYTFDLKTQKLKNLGRFFPEGAYAPGRAFSYGFDFDSKGRMWYNVSVVDASKRINGAGVNHCGRLFMWDIFNGKAPIDYGIIGSSLRSVMCVSELMIYNDIMYIANGNYLLEPVGMISIDLRKMPEAPFYNDERTFSCDLINFDPYPKECFQYYAGTDLENQKKYLEKALEYFAVDYAIQMANTINTAFHKVSGISCWQKTGRKNSSIGAIEWLTNDKLNAYCGNSEKYCVSVSVSDDGSAFLEKISETSRFDICRLLAPVPSVPLPFMPGRQYLAEAESSVAMSDGSIIVGTKDMMLCKIKDGKVFSLGAVCNCGGVHSLSATPDGKKVYGVAGYEVGMAEFFSYDDEKGIQFLGRVPAVIAQNRRRVMITNASVLSVSPDGRRIAIGGRNELSGVVIITL